MEWKGVEEMDVFCMGGAASARSDGEGCGTVEASLAGKGVGVLV